MIHSHNVKNKKLSEKELAKAKELLDLTFKNVPDAIFLIKKGGSVLLANHLAAFFTGFNTTEELSEVEDIHILQKRTEEVWDIFDEKGKQVSVYNLATFTTLKTNEPVTVVQQWVHKASHKHIWVLTTATPISDDLGNLSMILTVLSDITIQKTAEEKIRQSEEQLRVALEGGELGFYDYYPQTGKLVWSHKMRELYGVAPDTEINFEIYQQIIYPDDWKHVISSVEKALTYESGGKYENEYRVVRLTDGKLRWLRSKGKAYFDPNQKAERFSGVVQDITRQKEALNSLRLQSLVLERMEEGVSVSDEHGIILLTNAAEDQMFGYDEGELIGKHVTIQNAYPPDENEKIVNSVINELKQKGFWNGEWHNRKKDGTDFYTHSYITEIYIEGKRYFVCVQRDVTEEKRAKEALAQREERYRHIFEGTPVSIWEEDFSFVHRTTISLKEKGIHDFRAYFSTHTQKLQQLVESIVIKDVNDATLKLLDAHSKEELKKGLQQIFIEDTTEAFIRELEVIANGGGHFEYESVIQSFKGRRIEVLIHINFPKTDDYSSVLVTLVDISERRRTEKALKSTKELLEISFKNFPAGISLMDNTGKVLFVNEVMAKTLGYDTAEELMKEDIANIRKNAVSVYDLYNEHKEPLNLETAPAATTLRTGKPAEAVILAIDKKDKRSFWMLSKASPLLNEQGQTVMVLSTVTDITSQKIAEEKIKESENYFRTLTQSLPQLIWTTDKNGEADFFNQQWYDFTGSTPEQSFGYKWAQYIHPDQIEKVLSEWQHSLKTGESIKTEFKLRNKDSVYKWFYVAGSPIRDENGSILKWVETVTNIEERKEIEEQLEQLIRERTQELERSNQDLQQFAHVTSHDLKEPIRKIQIFASRLSEEYGDQLTDKAKHYLSKVFSASHRMSTMIDGVLTYSKVDAFEEKIEQINLNGVVKSIENDLEVLITQKRATIKTFGLPVIDGAIVLIHQLFYNLIYNSLKFSKPDIPPIVVISAIVFKNDGKDFAKITVTDNGIGFHPQYAEKIFEAFTRLNSKDKYEGTGLGLALCKKIVQRHSGSISADSKLNEGAIFTIILPLQQNVNKTEK